MPGENEENSESDANSGADDALAATAAELEEAKAKIKALEDAASASASLVEAGRAAKIAAITSVFGPIKPEMVPAFNAVIAGKAQELGIDLATASDAQLVTFREKVAPIVRPMMVPHRASPPPSGDNFHPYSRIVRDF